MVELSPSQNLMRRVVSPTRLLALAVSTVIVVSLYRRMDRGSLREVLTRLDVRWLLMALAALGASLSLASWRWHQMLRLSNAQLRHADSWRWTLIGHCFSGFFFGAAVSDVAKSSLYSRWKGFGMTQILAASALDRVVGAISTGIYTLLTVGLALVAAPEFPTLGWKTPKLVEWILVLSGAVLLGLGGMWMTQRRWLPHVRRFYGSVKSMTSLLKGRPGLIVQAVLAGLLMQVLISAVLACSLQAVSDQPLPWKLLLWTFPVIGVVASLPLTISGAGAREGASIVLWGGLGIPASMAFSASLLTLCVTLLWALCGGGLLWYEATLSRRSATLPTSSPRSSPCEQ